MKLKTELLAITAASILACSTAFAEGAGPGVSESGSATPGASQSVTNTDSPSATGAASSESSQSASASSIEPPRADAQPSDAEQRAEARASVDPTSPAAGLPAEGGGTAGGSSVSTPEDAQSTGSAERAEAQSPSTSEILDNESEQSASGSGMAGGSMQQLDSQTVRDIQQALNDKGFEAGPVDGIVGPKTQSALREFQQDQGMQASGEADQETLSALGVQG